MYVYSLAWLKPYSPIGRNICGNLFWVRRRRKRRRGRRGKKGSEGGGEEEEN